MAVVATGRRGASGRRSHHPGGKLLFYVGLTLLALLTLVPFLWGLSTSLKGRADIYAYPPQWIPSPVHWANYTEIWREYPFHLFYWNSLYISVVIVGGQLLTSSLAGFVFARLRFPGRDKLFLVYLASMMVPGQVIMIPIFLIVKYLGWIDSHLSLIVPALAGPFGTFLFRQFYLSVPEDLVDAAKIDGCNPLQTYYHVFLPISKPALATLGVFTFMGTWNSFLWPLILLRTPALYTVTLGLATLQGADQFRTAWQYVMAGTMTAMIPVLLVFLAAQRYFVEGITITGLKG
jgi:multiple sugar transport system permease protein